MAVLDVLALALLYLVFQDLAWRTSYVSSEHLVPSTTYLPFVRVFSITGSRVQFQLVSPPALDWVQVIVVLLAVANGFHILSTVRRTPSKPEQATPLPP